MSEVDICPVCRKLPASVQHEHAAAPLNYVHGQLTPPPVGKPQICPEPGCKLPLAVPHEHVVKKILPPEGARCWCGLPARVIHEHVDSKPPLVVGG